ncbi:hypothetical protein BJ875DRAFT_441383 [Amylocarpus encephaloides]|uniref:Uncharacterized protein n=1 Tax=Amylocarpus encephaloides TaxID=45428 RepID=A0A9P7YJF6_9HELO|nr:hypothetical protein BJ875DRAFT_441383 [Amylocarpus encephaloides]
MPEWCSFSTLEESGTSTTSRTTENRNSSTAADLFATVLDPSSSAQHCSTAIPILTAATWDVLPLLPFPFSLSPFSGVQHGLDWARTASATAEQSYLQSLHSPTSRFKLTARRDRDLECAVRQDVEAENSRIDGDGDGDGDGGWTTYSVQRTNAFTLIPNRALFGPIRPETDVCITVISSRRIIQSTKAEPVICWNIGIFHRGASILLFAESPDSSKDAWARVIGSWEFIQKGVSAASACLSRRCQTS